MDAMKDALRKRMQAPPMMEDPAVKSGEAAPSLMGGDDEAAEGEMASGSDPALLQAAEGAIGSDELNKILMAIADSGSAPGRGDTLGGRAAMGAQAKLDSFKK